MGGGRFEGFDLERLGHGCHKDFYQGHGRNKRELTRESAREKIIWQAQKLPLVAQECGKIRKRRLCFRTVWFQFVLKLCVVSAHIEVSPNLSIWGRTFLPVQDYIITYPFSPQLGILESLILAWHAVTCHSQSRRFQWLFTSPSTQFPWVQKFLRWVSQLSCALLCLLLLHKIFIQWAALSLALLPLSNVIIPCLVPLLRT